METILKFKLPEEKIEAEIASHAMDWALALWDLDQKLRNKIKYEDDLKSEGETLKWAREVLHEIMEERGISFDMIQ